MNRIARIKERLSALNPHHLEIIDLSHLHSDHYASTEQHTHLKVVIVAESLKSKSKINQHRIINSLLAEEFSNGLHALSIQILNS